MEIPENERLLDPAEADAEIARLDGWAREGKAITKTFTLKGFKNAVAFVNRVADAAAEQDHHPDIHLERYKRVRIVMTTHITDGISRADIDLARTCDQIAGALT